MATSKDGKAPCEGLRVLDFTSVVSGPFCSQALGDYGADVIKLEGLRGDMSRSTSGPFHGGLSGFFSQFNRNKRSIALDLKSPAGREVVLRLARQADIVVENFRPDVMGRLGIGYETLAGVNPKLIYLSISGFGPDGPYAPLPAYDHVVQGLTGMMPSTSGVHGNQQDWRKSPYLKGKPPLPEYFKNHGYWTGGCGKLFHANHGGECGALNGGHGGLRGFNHPQSWSERHPSKDRQLAKPAVMPGQNINGLDI